MAEFESEQIKIIAGSVDPVDKGQELVQKLGLTYPVAYGMNAEEVSRSYGAYYEKEKGFLHATGFLLGPDNRIINLCYSSGPLGRLRAENVLSAVRFYKQRK